MGVDLLRSCYRTKARLIRGSAEAYDLIWYFTAADPLPFRCAVNSLNWTDVTERVDDGKSIGEIPGAKRTWSNGKPPGGTAEVFPAPWGTVTDFVEGALLGPPFTVDDNGYPVCCRPCQSQHFAFSRLIVTIAGAVSGTYAFGDFNGIWDTDSMFSDGCDWYYPTGPGTQLRFTTGSGVVTIMMFLDGIPAIDPIFSVSVPETLSSEPVAVVVPMDAPIPEDWGSLPLNFPTDVYGLCWPVTPGNELTDEDGLALLITPGLAVLSVE